MKRNIDLIRELLIKLENLDDGGGPGYGTWYMVNPYEGDFVVNGYTPDQISHNLDLLVEAGFVKGESHLTSFELVRLTWQGCEFLDSIRDPDIWLKTKEGTARIGGTNVEFLWKVAKELGKLRMKEKLGIDLR